MSLDFNRSANYETREEWLSARRFGIGGSDAPAVLNQSPWASPWSVWAEKKGVINSRNNESRRLLIGQLMEPVIARLYELETGYETACPGQFRIFEGPVPYQRATLDRVNENEIPVELKTEANPQKWRDGPPLYYQIQAQHQMTVVGAERLYLAVFFGPNFDFAVHEVERNDRFIDAMTRAEGEFWGLVETGDAPEIDGTEATREALQRIPVEEGEKIELPAEELLTLDRRRQEAHARLQESEAALVEIENRIKSLMGPAEMALLNGRPAYTWKGDKRGTRRFLRVLKEGK